MQLFQRLRGFVAAGLLGLGTLGVGAATAKADHYGSCCHYEWVVCYELREVPYTKCFTVYDHCGRPYEVTKTCWRTVQVPVRHRVLVCD